MAKLIDISDVPKKVPRRKWRDIFSGVPEGKALVIENENYVGALAMLNYFRCHHEFLDYSVMCRNREGKTVTYIVHKKEKEKKETPETT